jgi:Transposase, Mutator family
MLGELVQERLPASRQVLKTGRRGGRGSSRRSRSRRRPAGAGRYPYLWLDAKVEKVRDGGRVVRKALVLAYGVHESGYGEVIALDVGSRVLCTWASEIPHRSLARLPHDHVLFHRTTSVFGIVGAHLR